MLKERCRRVTLEINGRRQQARLADQLAHVYAAPNITMDSPRVKCLECGAKTWHQPAFAEGQRHVTKTFERTVGAWLSRVTIQDAVEMLGTSWHTVSEIDLARLKKLPKPKLSEVKRLRSMRTIWGSGTGSSRWCWTSTRRPLCRS